MQRHFVVALATLAILVTFAPSVDAMPLQWGIRGGWNFDAMEDAVDASDNPVSFDRSTGYNLGLFADFGAGPLGVRPGIGYLKTGSLWADTGFVSDDTTQLSYIVVPVDLRLKMGVPGISPYLATGPELRALVGGASNELEEALSKFGATWGVGLGLEIGPPMGGFRFMPEVRYSFDVTGLMKDEITVQGVTIPLEGGQKVESWRLSIGLVF